LKLHIGYTRDSRIINLLHRSLLKEDLDIEKKEEKERRTRRTRTRRKPSRFVAPFCNCPSLDPSTYVREWAEETKELRPKEWRNEEEEDDEDEEGSHHQSAKP
jgi:hypothetical protein